MNEIGARIREVRMEKGMTQAQLAEQSGLCRSYIMSIEAGQRNPTVKTVAAIAEALGISVKDLI